MRSMRTRKKSKKIKSKKIYDATEERGKMRKTRRKREEMT